MALILSIDVSGPKGLVILSENGIYIDSICNTNPMEHASFLQPAISTLLDSNNRQMTQLAAVALSNGPGSYTGLRVGLASAKGLCYALNIPLITINSLQLAAFAIKQQMDCDVIDTSKGAELKQYFKQAHTEKEIDNLNKYLICPMLDARRMEVFFALYDTNADPIIQSSAGIIDNTFLSDWLTNNLIIFSGNGSEKWKKICNHPNALFLPEPSIELAFSYFSYRLYQQQVFADIVLTEPYYSKAFYNAHSSNK